MSFNNYDFFGIKNNKKLEIFRVDDSINNNYESIFELTGNIQNIHVSHNGRFIYTFIKEKGNEDKDNVTFKIIQSNGTIV